MNTDLKQRQAAYRKKLYGANKEIKSLKHKILTMQVVMEHLKKNQSVSENAADHLEKTYGSVPHLLMNRYLKNIKNETITHESYPPVLREFAATLQFYSSKAYEEVRKEFAMALPHQATVRKWYQNVNCEPGFVSAAFDALKLRVEESQSNNKEVFGSLLLDEMSIKKSLEFDGKQMWGYVNVGVPTENDELQPATEVLVIMVVCHTGHWKIPIGYFFIVSLSAKEKANLIRESLIRLHEIGVIITSVTSDGPSTNFAMMKELGCIFDNVHNLKTWFNHPSANSQKVFCILDACHMVKLMRNNFASLQIIKDPNGNNICWSYIKKLYELQENEGLHIANKLKKAHLEWHRQKMKVHLAAQTLSNSIADAIDFLNKKMGIQEFKESEATTNFIRKVNCLFDILNSRSPQAKGFKSPLRISNENVWRPFLMETVQYLSRCTDVGGRPLWLTPKKTPFIGFSITSMSVCGIFDEFVKSGKLNYFLTYKVSQDHLEIFFCSVRSRNGWNNNPTCLQFKNTFRRLLLHTKISQGEGNCKVLDATTVLSIPSTSVKSTVEEVDFSMYRKFSYEPADFLLDHNYDILSGVVELNTLTSNVVTYISGYVVKMLEESNKCAECILGCRSTMDAINDESYSLISFKDKGGLHIPSYGLVKICQGVEIAIKNMLLSTDNKIPKEKNFMDIFVIANAQKYYTDIYNLFPILHNHFLESAPCDENHGFLLVKNIVRSYAKIRLYNLAKKHTETIQGNAVRRQLNKLILFNHQ
ncbi:unnamed protein product [Brassicogethes aeneus]|uniref:THAP domain-containing protein 9 n=1 Tax=Brassicogethes aeneus TaxID=1431903 RepID=A0A9P0BBM8_BRAAE|nr:unnamed protein product [Brassicogethes aeneus]